MKSEEHCFAGFNYKMVSSPKKTRFNSNIPLPVVPLNKFLLTLKFHIILFNRKHHRTFLLNISKALQMNIRVGFRDKDEF